MNPQIKKAWTAALRSGKFLKAQCRLRRGDSFCCLGVLCHLLAPTEWFYDGIYGYIMREQDHYVPAALADAAGLSRPAQDYLSGLNDNEDMSFAKLADEIERIL